MKNRKIISSVGSLLLGITVLLSLSATEPSVSKNEITLTPESCLMTEAISAAIDQISAKGGGTIRFSQGTYLSGTIELKNNVTLLFDKGAVLQGSDKYSDYRNDAFIYGENLSNIAITGEGTIDGVDCYNPKGEEGFRGPHCIRLIRCNNIKMVGITILRSANWAINCRYCSGGYVENVKIRGGHDGLHTRFCEKFTVKGCDFRTGDDAFAGNDNRDFVITDCRINTSCNRFRMGCLNFTVKLLSPALFNATSYGQIELRKVTLSKQGTAPVMSCNSGNSIILNRVSFISDNPSESYSLDKIQNRSLTKNKFIQPETK